MDPKPFILLFALIFVIYLLARREKPLEFRPSVRKKRKLPLSHDAYIKSVLEKENKKEQESRMRAEEKERIKKDFYKL
jgi:hypothetical protein